MKNIPRQGTDADSGNRPHRDAGHWHRRLRQGASHDLQRRDPVDGVAGLPCCWRIDAVRCPDVCRI